ncbi:uncharacterized protein LOC134832007 [Culicoides brevitarsis]|uniref:uncharacterized protein LOC134832007 n=1 Tax=Culicoides brevitarsis TaxID=469753 RepID=UPI00307C22E1
MDILLWNYGVKTFLNHVLDMEFTLKKADLDPIKDLIELKSTELLNAINDISGQLRETQRAIDELGREIHWEFISAPINEIRDTIDAKFARYIKYAASDHWERETKEKFADELVSGHDSVENFLAIFNTKVYQNDNQYFDANTQRIHDMSEKLSTKSGEPAQVALYRFYSMLLIVELKVFIMQAAAYTMKTELGHGKFVKEKRELVLEFGDKFRKMKNQVMEGDRTLWKLDPDKHVEADPLDLFNRGNYVHGYTYKRVTLWRWMHFFVYNRHAARHYFNSNKMSLSFSNHYTKASSYGNYVITGMRFVRPEKASGDMYLELFESQLLPHGKIDPKTTRTVQRNTDEESNTLHIGTDFTTINVNHDLLLEEQENQGQNFVITGVKIVASDAQLKLELTYTEFDFESGKLKPHIKILTGPNSTHRLEIKDKSYPTDFYDHRPSEEKRAHVKFDSCKGKKKSEWNDLRIAPFLDTQKVCSTYMALAGVSFILRDNDMSAGFISPKLTTFPIQFAKKQGI